MPDDCPDWSDYCQNADYKDFMMENCRSFCKLYAAPVHTPSTSLFILSLL